MKRRAFCRSALLAVGAAAFSGAGRAIEIAGRDVDDFRKALSGPLLAPGDPRFDAARRLWNGAFDHRPALIARCADASDVARCADFARAHDLLVAVRGGGHSFPGHSSCDGGLMIDLSPMRAVRVERAVRIEHALRRIHVGPGALLGELDRAALASGLVTSTGTVSHTGVAGLTLGGGFGRLARKLGLACDNLLAADVVTAAGRQVKASARENPDLFWALRGGGGNFGIVTSFELQLHRSPARTTGGVLVFPFVKPRALLRAFADFAQGASEEFFAMVDIVPTPAGGRVAAVEVCHCGAPAVAEREIATLRKIGALAQDTVRPTPYLSLQSRIDKDYPAGRGYYLKSGFIRTLGPQIIDAVVDHLEAPAPRCLASFILLGGAVARVRPDATAYWHREAQHGVLLAGFWDAPADADAPRDWVRKGWAKLEPLTDGFYVNLMAPDEGAQRIRNTYGANYQRLVALKTRYDPTNLFRLNANIAPLATRERS